MLPLWMRLSVPLSLCLCLSRGRAALADPAAPAPTETALDAPSVVRNAVLTNPLGLVSGLAGRSFDAGLLNLNVKGRRAFTELLGLNAVASFSYMDLYLDYYSIHLKAGPRVLPLRSGFRGWYIDVNVLVGEVWANNQGGANVLSGTQLGIGAESGYVWIWKRFVLELGAGAYWASFIDYRTKLAGDAGAKPGGTLPLRPVLNLSLGYAW